MATKRAQRLWRTAYPLNCTRLEDRLTPTSKLYLDFGDNFPVGGFDLTVGTLRQTFANGGLQGPNLTGGSYTDATAIRFRPTSTRVTFDYNGSGVVDAADWTDLRATALSIVQRYYAPFDVDVVLAPALDATSSATYFAGVQATMQAGLNQAGECDAWAFMVDAIRTATGSSVGNEKGIYGIASGADIGGDNDRDDSCLICADVVLGAFGNNTADNALAYTGAHEPAHTFGLAHTSDTGATNALLSSSDVIVGSAGNTNRTNFDFFTRYPLILDGSSTNTANNYDRFASENVLGLRPGAPAYITGTGAHDIITVTRLSATQATVAVQAFSNATYTTAITVPGSSPASTTYSYTVPLDATAGLLIDGGFNNDRITIDATIAVPVTVRGMAGTDQLIVHGNGAATGSYTPGATAPTGLDGNVARRGTVVVGSTTIQFDEYDAASTVEVDGVAAFNIITPNSSDVLTLDASANGRFQVSGSSGGIALVTLLADVSTLTIDSGTNDAGSPNDAITVNLGTLSSPGTRQAIISTGAGDDGFNVLALASGAALTLNCGLGNDSVLVDSNGASVGGNVDSILGALAINGQGGTGTLTLEGGADTSGDIVTANGSQIGVAGDTFFGVGGSLTYSELTSITMNLSAGTTGDAVKLTPSSTATFVINANAPVLPTASGDRLTLALDSVTNPLRTPANAFNGVWTFGNRQSVTYTNVEEQSVSAVPDVTIGDGTIQRSRITQLQVAFDHVVGFLGNAFTLEELSGGVPVGMVSIQVSTSDASGVTVASISFLSDTTGGSLDDGRYRLTVLASQITVSGVTTTGDTTTDFHRFFGDANGDSRLDIADFGQFSGAFNTQSPDPQFNPIFDYNNDGRVDITDFGQFSIRYFTTLP